MISKVLTKEEINNKILEINNDLYTYWTMFGFIVREKTKSESNYLYHLYDSYLYNPFEIIKYGKLKLKTGRSFFSNNEIDYVIGGTKLDKKFNIEIQKIYKENPNYSDLDLKKLLFNRWLNFITEESFVDDLTKYFCKEDDIIDKKEITCEKKMIKLLQEEVKKYDFKAFLKINEIDYIMFDLRTILVGNLIRKGVDIVSDFDMIFVINHQRDTLNKLLYLLSHKRDIQQVHKEEVEKFKEIVSTDLKKHNSKNLEKKLKILNEVIKEELKTNKIYKNKEKLIKL